MRYAVISTTSGYPPSIQLKVVPISSTNGKELLATANSREEAEQLIPALSRQYRNYTRNFILGLILFLLFIVIIVTPFLLYLSYLLQRR